jgi:hypothetical protein
MDQNWTAIKPEPIDKRPNLRGMELEAQTSEREEEKRAGRWEKSLSVNASGWWSFKSD